jgi:hypothetical protein
MIGSAAAQSAETVTTRSRVGLGGRRAKIPGGSDKFVDEGDVFLGVGFHDIAVLDHGTL